jgi:nicotinamidase-related amidase
LGAHDGSQAIVLAQADSRDSLFGDTPKASEAPSTGPSWRGFVRGKLAYTYAEPTHWSKMVVRGELDAQGALTDRIKFKVGARLDYDFVYDATDFYPSDVRRDQRFNAWLRENYLDVGAGDWDFRVGRQHIVWGEMVGLFFADVVSAKDLREFILPDFDELRIPQWAARAEYFKGDFHAEAVWIPVPSYDDIGKPGAEFFPAVPPAPPGFATLFDNEQFPKREVANGNYGLRLSVLKNGWDVSGFYYRSLDAQPTFYRTIVETPQPAVVYQARHDRIDQWGGTLAKDFGSVVFKAETVYTRGRSYSVLRPDDLDGVVRQNTLDVVGGVDFTPTSDTRVNVQLFERAFFDHDPDIIPKRHEPGFSLLVNQKLTDRIEAEVLWITSLARSDWMLRPHVAWDFQKNWRLIAGVDIFNGPPLGLFGQFANRDRIYTEVRYSF